MTITAFTPLKNMHHCILNDTRIDLWQFSLEHELNITAQLLHGDEKARGERFYFSRHKRRFMTSRAILRIILARYLNVAPESLEFRYNQHGKPEVINSQNIQFNLSHTGDLAIIAVGKKYPIGIDIERYSARPYEGIAENLFSDKELDEFKKVPARVKPAVFFHIWSQKEAFIKSCGLGLSYPTKEFSVPTTIPTRQLIHDPIHKTVWQLHSFMPSIACSGALCHHPTIRDIRHGIVPIHQQGILKY